MTEVVCRLPLSTLCGVCADFNGMQSMHSVILLECQHLYPAIAHVDTIHGLRKQLLLWGGKLHMQRVLGYYQLSHLFSAMHSRA